MLMHSRNRWKLALVAGVGLPLLLAAGLILTRRGASLSPVPLWPQPLMPPDGAEFVASDLEIAWHWPPGLARHEVFVLQVWVDDAPPLEVWTQANHHHLQPMIDALSREVGDFRWRVAVVRRDAHGDFAALVSEWSPVQTLKRVRRISPTPWAEQSPAAAWLLAQHYPTPTDLIDAVRHFIYQNSSDAGLEDDAYDVPGMVEALFAHAQGQLAAAPMLLCDARSLAMMQILREVGIESRLIFLYGGAGDTIAEHTFLEVFDPAFQRWHVQDPYQDVYYVEQASGERVDTARLVFGSLAGIVPCRAEGQCGWQVSIAPDLLAAFRYGHSDTFWVNPDRFPVSKRFAGNQNANLAEYLTGNAQDFSLRLVSWQDETLAEPDLPPLIAGEAVFEPQAITLVGPRPDLQWTGTDLQPLAGTQLGVLSGVAFEAVTPALLMAEALSEPPAALVPGLVLGVRVGDGHCGVLQIKTQQATKLKFRWRMYTPDLCTTTG